MAPSSEAADRRRIWTVSELIDISRDVLAEAFPFAWVRGEVSGFSAPASGHWYFDLKDDKALVPVAMFSRANSQVPFAVEEGMEVVVGGEVTIYPLRGKYQVIAEVLEPVGWGALQLAFEQLKARLAEEGLFDPARKRALPLLPRCVGVVTSASGAAWRDMCRVWKNNDVPIRALLAPAQVQGTGAASEIAAALARLNRHGRADVIIVGRGGGSREDLWAFNEEPVARAIAASEIPVVSAVGHEIDVTIADLVADQRAATPTAAAELVAASRASLVERLRANAHRAVSATRRRASTARHRLNQPALRRNLAQPGRLLAVYRQRLDDAFVRVERNVHGRVAAGERVLQSAGRRLTVRSPAALALRRRGRIDAAVGRATAAARRRLDLHKGRLATAAGRIEALSPLAVLARGYAICERRSDDAIVRTAADVAIGERLRVRLEKDALECTVDATAEGTTPRPL